MIEKAIRQLLIADGTVNGLVAGRIYPNRASQGAAPPYVVYRRIIGLREKALDGAVGRTQATIQIDSRSDSYDQVKILNKAIRDALENFAGDVSVGSPPTVVVVTALSHDGDQDIDDDDTVPLLHRVSADYLVAFND